MGVDIAEEILEYVRCRLDMIIDHIGIVVSSLDKGIEKWRRLFGYDQLTEITTNTRQKVNVVFLEKENSAIVKLIEPTDDSSPVFLFAKRSGGLHHLCFRTENLDAEIARLESESLRILARPQPGEAFDNKNIAFVYAQDGLNIELIDTARKANILFRK
ncbi:MAG: hypothetical protein GF398_04120 [Chitinivibrionales bacterium]|nr:hypothetical protein [Chitinivibrionales bacterium]